MVHALIRCLDNHLNTKIEIFHECFLKISAVFANGYYKVQWVYQVRTSLFKHATQIMESDI